MFKSKLFYVKIYENRMEVINLNTEQEISRQSNKKFSNDRLVLADFSIATEFLSTILNEIDTQWSLFGQRKFVIQQFLESFDNITEIENTALKDLGAHCKGNTVKVINQQQELTIAQAKAEINK